MCGVGVCFCKKERKQFRIPPWLDASCQKNDISREHLWEVSNRRSPLPQELESDCPYYQGWGYVTVHRTAEQRQPVTLFRKRFNSWDTLLFIEQQSRGNQSLCARKRINSLWVLEFTSSRRAGRHFVSAPGRVDGRHLRSLPRDKANTTTTKRKIVGAPEGGCS